MGLPAIANQTFRLIAHQRLHQAVEQWQEKYPGVDIVLVEPEPNDELMFGTPIMDYSRRLKIARHGFESVTATLAKDYDRYKEIAERHGLEISERRVRRVVERAAEEEPEQTSAWRRVLEQTTSVLLRQSGEASQASPPEITCSSGARLFRYRPAGYGGGGRRQWESDRGGSDGDGWFGKYWYPVGPDLGGDPRPDLSSSVLLSARGLDLRPAASTSSSGRCCSPSRNLGSYLLSPSWAYW